MAYPKNHAWDTTVADRWPFTPASRAADEATAVLVAYEGRQHALDAVMCGSTNFTWVQRPEDVPAFFGELVMGTLRQKAAIASQLISPEEAMCLVSSKTRKKTVKTKRGDRPKAKKLKGTAQGSVDADVKPKLLQSIPSATLGEFTVPMTTDLAESDEVRVSEFS